MSNIYDELKDIVGVPFDTETGEPLSDVREGRFYTCQSCGQSVDMSNLGQVFHHEESGHKPLPVN